MSTTPTFSSVTATNGTNTVVVDGAAGIITGLTNKTWTGTPVTGRAATEDQLGVLSSDITNITNGTMQLDYVKSNKTTTSVAADASGTDSTALGYSSQATGGESVAVGNTAKAGDLATAVGYGSAASSNGSTAVGIQTSASNQFSFAAGYQAKASGQSSEAIGDNSQSSAMGSTALGSYSNASADGAVALGPNSAASGITSIAEGYLSQALKESSIALGTSSIDYVKSNKTTTTAAVASGTDSAALGYGSSATGGHSTAVGNNSTAKDSYGTAIGYGAIADSVGNSIFANTTAVGALAKATGGASVALGSSAVASGNFSTALGASAQANGAGATAVGDGTKANGIDSVALGSLAVASGDRSIAQGVSAKVNLGADNGIALGTNATAQNANSVALGSNSATAASVPTSTATINGKTYTFTTTGAANAPTSVVSIGSTTATRQLTNVANGQVGQNSTDAINGSQLYAVASDLGQGTKFAADSYSGTATQNNHNAVPGTTVNIVGGNGSGTYSASNIKTYVTNDVTSGDGTVSIQMSTTPTFDSVTAGTGANQVITGSDGVKVGGNTYITGSGLNANSQKVTNVANGTAANDAVNFSQLTAAAASQTASDKHVLAGSYAVNTTTNSVSLPIVSGDELSSSVNAVITDVASAAKLNIVSGDVTNIKNNITNLTDNGITTAGNDGTATLPLGKKLTVKGTATTAGTYSSSNIKTVQTTGADGNTIEVQIADNPEFTSVTAGTGANQVITGSDGVKVGGNTYITGSGLNANSQKVTNVANGTADSDAVNLSQLKASAAGSTTKLENGKNTTVSYTTATDGSKTYKVDLNDDITMGTGTNAVAISGTNGTIKTGTVTIAGGSTNTVTGLSNKTWDGTTITSGRSATEDQLKLAQAAAVAAAGKADTHVKAGTYTPTNGTVAMDIVNNEGTATGEQVKITDIASKTQQDTNTTNIAKNTTNITNLTNKVDSGWTAQVNGTDVKTVTPTSSKLNFTAGDNIVLANDGGSIKITSTGGTDSAAVHYDKDTSGNVDKTNLTLGDGSKPTTIKNVAAGTIAKGSTEAVNGGQLYDTNQRIDNAYTQIGALGSEIEKVGAKAAALSGLHPLDYDPSYKWDFTAAFGGYRSEQAAALGVFYHADENTLFNAAVTVGNSENLYRFGVSMRLGPDSKHHSITSREALIKQVNSLTAENQSMKSENQDIKIENQIIKQQMGSMMKRIEELESKTQKAAPAVKKH